MKTRRWLPLWLNLVLLAIAISLYAPLGLRGNFGLFEEFTARYGYLRVSVAIRFTTYWSFQFADWLAPDSYVGFNWLMVATFWLKGALMTGIMGRLLPKQPGLALTAGLLMIVFPSDSGYMTLRSVAIHFVIVCALAAIFGVIRYWQKPHWAWWLWIVPMQVLALAYEINYPIFLLVPLIWLVIGIQQRGTWRGIGETIWERKWLTLAWGMTPLILGLRALWIIQRGDGGYVSNVVNISSENDPLTLATAREGLQTLFERHLFGWQDGLNLLADAPYAHLAVLLGIISGLLVWAYYRQPSLKWRVYLMLFGFGIALLLAAYVLYLPTPFRLDSFRINIITTIGATTAVAAILAGVAQALGKLGRYGLAGATAVLVMGGMAFQLDQAAHYGDLSSNIQRLLGGIAAEAPAVDSDSVIVYVDRDYAYQVPMQLGGRSYIFEEALQFLYDDQALSAILCVPTLEQGRHTCTFTADELISIDDLGNEERLPYERLIVLQKGYDGRVHLLKTFPPEHLPDGTTATPAAYAPLNRVNQQAAAPDRVYSAFPCWPLEGCLEFPPLPEPVNTVRLDMDTSPPGLGWESAYTPLDARWTTRTDATLHLYLIESEPLQVQFKVNYALLPEIWDSLALLVNGTAIPLTRTPLTDGTSIYAGVIPVEVLAQDPYGLDETLLVIHTDHVAVPKELGLNEDTRALGLLIDWLEIGPLSSDGE